MLEFKGSGLGFRVSGAKLWVWEQAPVYSKTEVVLLGN